MDTLVVRAMKITGTEIRKSSSSSCRLPCVGKVSIPSRKVLNQQNFLRIGHAYYLKTIASILIAGLGFFLIRRFYGQKGMETDLSAK